MVQETTPFSPPRIPQIRGKVSLPKDWTQLSILDYCRDGSDFLASTTRPWRFITAVSRHEYVARQSVFHRRGPGWLWSRILHGYHVCTSFSLSLSTHSGGRAGIIPKPSSFLASHANHDELHQLGTLQLSEVKLYAARVLEELGDYFNLWVTRRAEAQKLRHLMRLAAVQRK